MTDHWTPGEPSAAAVSGHDGLYRAACWTLAGGLLLAPLALVSFVLAVMLVMRGRTTAGVIIMCLSVLAGSVPFFVYFGSV